MYAANTNQNREVYLKWGKSNAGKEHGFLCYGWANSNTENYAKLGLWDGAEFIIKPSYVSLNKQLRFSLAGSNDSTAVQILEPNLASGKFTCIEIGKTATLKNRALIAYIHSTDDNTDSNNRLAIYLNGGTLVFTVIGSGLRFH